MLRKKLFIFYFLGPGNDAIAKSDFDKFYGQIRKSIDSNKDLTIGYASCTTVANLLEEIENLTKPEAKLDELYFHFSGHGAVEGIPYDNWIIANDNFAGILQNPKIKFCFFSSCQSADLAKLVSKAKVPVVIGTAGANNIENDYAIRFQNLFYGQLLASASYGVAYTYAVSNANQKFFKDNKLEPIVRGESGGDILDIAQINELQLIVTSEKVKDQFLLPPDWVRKMNEVDDDRNWCLNWFDSELSRDHFYKGLEGEGLGEVLKWEELPTSELYLLKDRGDDDPFQYGDGNLIIHCSKKKLLPEELLSYLEDEKSRNNNHCKVIFCLKQGLATNKEFGCEELLKLFPDDQKFEFKKYSADLIPLETFRAALDKNKISASERRKIVMNFDTKPIKDEFREVEIKDKDKQNYIRIFFARNTNERLINFIANWIKSTRMPNSLSFVADNRHNTQLDLLADLKNQLGICFKNTNELHQQFYELYKAGGAIIILRNWSEDPNTSIAIVQNVLVEVKKAADFYGAAIPKQPTLLFVLHEDLFQESIPEDKRISLKPFTNPYVNKDMIVEWAALYSPKTSASTEVVEKVMAISGKINPDDYKEKCPSGVLEFICKELDLPQSVVFKI